MNHPPFCKRTPNDVGRIRGALEKATSRPPQVRQPNDCKAKLKPETASSGPNLFKSSAAVDRQGQAPDVTKDDETT